NGVMRPSKNPGELAKIHERSGAGFLEEPPLRCPATAMAKTRDPFRQHVDRDAEALGIPSAAALKVEAAPHLELFRRQHEENIHVALATLHGTGDQDVASDRWRTNQPEEPPSTVVTKHSLELDAERLISHPEA